MHAATLSAFALQVAMVPAAGLEPAASRSQTGRATVCAMPKYFLCLLRLRSKRSRPAAHLQRGAVYFFD